jgi:hypothetical protein
LDFYFIFGFPNQFPSQISETSTLCSAKLLAPKGPRVLLRSPI